MVSYVTCTGLGSEADCLFSCWNISGVAEFEPESGPHSLMNSTQRKVSQLVASWLWLWLCRVWHSIKTNLRQLDSIHNTGLRLSLGAFCTSQVSSLYAETNGAPLSPGRCHAIIWTNAGILLIGPLGTNFSEILNEIDTFSFKKMDLKMSSAKWHPFCLGLNVLMPPYQRLRIWYLFNFRLLRCNLMTITVHVDGPAAFWIRLFADAMGTSLYHVQCGAVIMRSIF